MSFLHLLAQTACKSVTLEDARDCDYVDSQESRFTSGVGPFRPGSPPSYSTGAMWPQSAGGMSRRPGLGETPQGRGGAAGILQEGMGPPGFPVQLENRKPAGKSQDGFCGCQTHPISREDTDSLHHINRLCCQKFLWNSDVWRLEGIIP